MIFSVVDRRPVGTPFESPLRLALTSSASCTDSTIGSRRCRFDPDCGAGSVCRASGEGNTLIACGGRCEPEACGDVGQIPCEAARVCTTVDLSVNGTPVVLLPLSLSQSPAALPSDIVFSELARSWFVSLPGSRSLAEIRTGPAGGTFSIRHVR